MKCKLTSAELLFVPVDIYIIYIFLLIFLFLLAIFLVSVSLPLIGNKTQKKIQAHLLIFRSVNVVVCFL